ncbi:MAG TPA: MFS transporter [Candidatus Cybelea sp.]|nr:MFS transporter [Candidatus Cybelea sp.]
MTNLKPGPCDEAAIRSVRAAAECSSREKFWVLVVTVLASSIAYIDESVVNIALPAIETDLRAPVAVIQWLVNAYTVCFAALLLIGGTAGDRFGRRRVFVLGMGVFAASSLWCGLAPSIGQLIAARAVQGFGSALLVPCALALIGASFGENERGKAIGTWAACSAIAAAVGPVLGGLIVDHTTWRWIFLINPFLAVPTIFIAVRHVSESRDPKAPATLDWPGAILAFAGLGSAIFGLIAAPSYGWEDARVAGPLVFGVLILAAFAWQEARSRSPMMPLDLFKSLGFSGINLLTLLLYAALAGAFLFLPFDLIQVHGYSAALAGTAFLPFTVIMGALSRWSGGLLDRFGARLPLIAGPAIAALGFGLLALPAADASYWIAFFVPIVALGFGMAVTVAPLTTFVINVVPEARIGIASGVNNAAAALANVLAVAVLGAVALGAFDRGLDRRLAGARISPQVREVVESARSKFVVEVRSDLASETERAAAKAVIKDSLAGSIRLVMSLAAGLALAGSASAALLIRSPGVASGSSKPPFRL